MYPNVAQHAGTSDNHQDAIRLNADVCTLSCPEEFGLILRDGRECIRSTAQFFAENSIRNNKQDESKDKKKNNQPGRNGLH